MGELLSIEGAASVVHPGDIAIFRHQSLEGRLIAASTRTWASHVALVMRTTPATWYALETSPKGGLWKRDRSCEVRMEPAAFYRGREFMVVRPRLADGHWTPRLGQFVADIAYQQMLDGPHYYPVGKLLGYALRSGLRGWVGRGPAGVCSRRVGEPWSAAGLVWRDGMGRVLNVTYQVTPATILRQALRDGWQPIYRTAGCPEGV